MFGHKDNKKQQDKSFVVAGQSERRSKKRKSEVNNLSSANGVKKFKWNGTEHTSDEICTRDNHPASAQWWRELMRSYASPSNGPLVRSEDIFRANVFVLLYGIDKCVGNPAQWSIEDTTFFFNKITNFICVYMIQLKKEKAFLDKANLENKRGLDSNRLNLLTSVYQESLKFMRFSVKQKRIIDSKFKELKYVISKVDESGPGVLHKSSVKVLLNNKVNELNEAWKEAHEYREEIKKAQHSLKETHYNSNASSLGTELKNTEHELNEAKKQAEECREELRKSPDFLKDHLKYVESSLEIQLQNKDFELNEAWKQADEFREELIKAQNSLKEAHLKFNELSLATELKNKDHELSVARKQADEYLAELRKMQASLMEAHLKWNKPTLASELLKNTNSELNEARKQADEYREELRKTQNSLKEAYLKLNAQMPTNYKQSEVDKQVTLEGCLQDEVKQLNDLQKQLERSVKRQKETEDELTKTRKQADAYHEELRKTQNSLEEAHLKLTVPKLTNNKQTQVNKQVTFEECLQDKVKQLTDLQQQLERSVKQQKETEDELTKTRKQADAYHEELRKTQNSLQEAYLKLNAHKPTNSIQAEVDKQVTLEGCLQDEVKQLNDLQKQLERSVKQQKVTEDELTQTRKQADAYHEELRKTQNSLKEANLKLNVAKPTNNKQAKVDKQVTLEGCLQDKVKQLNDLQKQLDRSVKQQKETEDELTETREQLLSFVSKNREMAQTKQKDINKKLTDIQTLLLMKNPNYKPNCQTENESLSKEEKLFEDIKAIIEYDTKSSTNANKQNTAESDVQTNSSSASLRVSEYEMHFFSLIAAFLKITPFPVSSQAVYSYVSNIDNAVDLQFVESLLRKFPSIFKEVAGAPGSMEKFWVYLDLKPVITL